MPSSSQHCCNTRRKLHGTTRPLSLIHPNEQFALSGCAEVAVVYSGFEFQCLPSLILQYSHLLTIVIWSNWMMHAKKTNEPRPADEICGFFVGTACTVATKFPLFFSSYGDITCTVDCLRKQKYDRHKYEIIFPQFHSNFGYFFQIISGQNNLIWKKLSVFEFVQNTKYKHY